MTADQLLLDAAEAIRAVALAHNLSIAATLATPEGETYSIIESPCARGDSQETLFRTRLADHAGVTAQKSRAATETLTLLEALERACVAALYEIEVVEDELRRRKNWRSDLVELRDALTEAFTQLGLPMSQVPTAVVRAVQVFSRLYGGQAGHIADYQRHLERAVRNGAIKSGESVTGIGSRRMMQIRRARS